MLVSRFKLTMVFVGIVMALFGEIVAALKAFKVFKDPRDLRALRALRVFKAFREI
jgi:hypothetical protein